MSKLHLDALQTHHVGPISLELAAGSTLALSGASGAGKSLLLRAIADIDPHQGTMLLDGASAQSFAAPEWRRRVTLLPAKSQWWFERVGDHFSDADEAGFSALGLTLEALDWQVSRCSTGERQRLSILRTLANRPSVLLLDEPTASLDQENIERVEALITKYREATGAALIWVSHDPHQIERIADRHLRFEAGTLVEAA